MKKDYVSVWLISFTIILILICLSLSFYYRDDFRLSTLSVKKFRGQIQCSVYANATEKSCMSLSLSIPCSSKEQYNDLNNKLPRLRHELLLSLSRPEVNEIMRKGKLEEAKKHLIQTINQVAKEPVEDLYFDSFSLF